MNLSKGVAAGVVVLMLVGVLASPKLLYANDESRAKELIHRPACIVIGWKGTLNRDSSFTLLTSSGPVANINGLGSFVG